MYKGKDFGTPFKKMGGGVRCLVAFEIRSGSYRVKKNATQKKICDILSHLLDVVCLRHIVALTTIYLTSHPEGGATLCHIDNYLLDTK
jgi:hypothetical protein